MSDANNTPSLYIQLPADLNRNCPECGLMMETQVLVDIQEGAEEIKKILLSCPSNTCDLLQLTRRWCPE